MIKKACFIISAVFVCISLTACSGGEGSLYYMLMTALGFDMNDYESEETIRVVKEDDAEYEEIVRIIGMLVIDNSHITPFTSPREASSGNRDAILNYMLAENYAAYNGNSALLLSASEEYPQYNITTLIPQRDFESTVYRNFGGDASVTHESGVRYTYLPRVSAYTTTGQPITVSVTITVDTCVETENTFRVTFTLTDSGEKSASYSAMMMKREDETIYMRYLKSAE